MQRQRRLLLLQSLHATLHLLQLVARLRNGTYGELYDGLEQLLDEPQDAQINDEEVEELERELVQYVEDASEDIEEWADSPRRAA